MAKNTLLIHQLLLNGKKILTMADVPLKMVTNRKISFNFPNKLNGVEPKTPFLIGVSGGTASGKVFITITNALLIKV